MWYNGQSGISIVGTTEIFRHSDTHRRNIAALVVFVYVWPFRHIEGQISCDNVVLRCLIPILSLTSR
jgi:hypothetical protein